MKILLATLFLSMIMSAVSANSYYSQDDIDLINGQIKDGELKTELQIIASKSHTFNTYKDARKYLYTNIYLEKDDNDRYFVEDIYCEKKVFNNAGPTSMPRGSKTNIEHSWPQSKFSNEFDKPLQKGDLHHLFVVNSSANHLRGHFNFGEVDSYYTAKGRCKNAGLGVLVKTPAHVAWSSNDYYEPPAEFRGNIARALFYFATRYNKKINDTQEYFLRKWHKEDPVTALDQERNDRIMEIQGNRNPFIDHPELVDRIKNL
ncbi:MAG: hypothetical protein BM556_01345 [Bacteriovorax sp. MedPE-SWde]|nr:MAG: hypothetical protein BM556_01345 [Bacteriovorax sp. MedPE-SWde]